MPVPPANAVGGTLPTEPDVRNGARVSGSTGEAFRTAGAGIAVGPGGLLSNRQDVAASSCTSRDVNPATSISSVKSGWSNPSSLRGSPTSKFKGIGTILEQKMQETRASTNWKAHFIPSVMEMHKHEEEDHVPSGGLRGLAFRVARNIHFRVTVNVIIIVNAAQMGIAADKQNWTTVWLVCDHFFTSVFAMEMVVQILALNCRYFMDSWCLLDFFVANLAILNTWILPTFFEGDQSKFGTLRILRLLRLLRMAKVMHVVPELMMVVEGIASSMKSMFWIFMLLIIILYTTSICCVEVIGHEEKEYPAYNPNQSVINQFKVDTFNNYMYFGTVLRSMLTLFNIVLLDEWTNVVRPVYEKQIYMIVFFILVIIVCAFGVLNLIIGIVVEKTTEAMNAVRHSHVMEEKRKQMELVKILADGFFEMDTDGNNQLSVKEMIEGGLSNPKLVEILSKLNLPFEFTFSELFSMLDEDGNGVVDKAELVTGIMRLLYCDDFQRNCLVAKSFGQIKEQVYKFHEEIREQLEAVAALVKEIQSPSQSGPSNKGKLQSSPHVLSPRVHSKESMSQVSYQVEAEVAREISHRLEALQREAVGLGRAQEAQQKYDAATNDLQVEPPPHQIPVEPLHNIFPPRMFARLADNSLGSPGMSARLARNHSASPRMSARRAGNHFASQAYDKDDPMRSIWDEVQVAPVFPSVVRRESLHEGAFEFSWSHKARDNFVAASEILPSESLVMPQADTKSGNGGSISDLERGISVIRAPSVVQASASDVSGVVCEASSQMVTLDEDDLQHRVISR